MYEFDVNTNQYIKVYDEEFSSDEEKNKRFSKYTVYLPRYNSTLSLKSRSLRRKSLYISRIINRIGKPNTFFTNVSIARSLNHFRDLGNTLVTIQWRWIITALFLVNFLSYLLFASLWLITVKFSDEANSTTPCVVNANSFTGYFLLSVETITTIGYGYRYPTEKCSQVWVLFVFQALLGVVIQGGFVSAVYVKMTKPIKRSSVFFSKKCVVCLRNGSLCLIFRMYDLFNNVSAGAKITFYFVDKDPKEDTQVTPFLLKLHELKIQEFGFLIFPADIVHVIDEESPLWSMSPAKLLNTRFELIAIVEGSSIITGQMSQNRTSYLNSEIQWGHRFVPCVEFAEDKMKYVVNCKLLGKTVPFDTPLCSAKKLREIESMLQEFNNGY